MNTFFLRQTKRDEQGRRYFEFVDPDLTQRLYVRKPPDDWSEGFPIVLEDFVDGKPAGSIICPAGKKRGHGFAAFFKANPKDFRKLKKGRL
ncbi:hypothetical protein CcrKarma_gp239 [Caulobacter virus Karma]|uniref:Uncharacterized protein n=5 Tax=Viruses TaxID=10239 RepID=J3U9G4_9CAUD|nr:hypothetical protein D865_gp191 [Caulobacter phage phiCbK]YP_006988915.1 hypothetical protein CcrMagneto_gp233 [Caulobacter virus Magneto]YP_006989619.1 hypothetical protein CcrKarma_gp239 [Caulobacter virus Karma]ARB13761.1 hypothetical protein Ccr10_gp231 [Caulobacter phage Ccr10]ARB14106.1 hypothetical protein Ccr2_gp230 [Caulobacter phage Ccr2]ARB14448.1 hypothetical protein Ccr5_gp228 [Caulobacter phage Ccr5]ARB14795.1 hypothetical protein Ccr29_gp239 [Caulobacter phage Ccr29]ARB1514